MHRRVGFGLPAAELREAAARGAEEELDRLMSVGPPTSDPWDDAQLPIEPNDRDAARYAISTWVQAMVDTATPVADRLAWIWHGHFVSGLDKVRIARLMVEQVRLFRRGGLGSMRDLVRSVTIDPAMLVYLDLRTSTGTEPNENYARELLELFMLGEGTYTEADVQAGAAALTGWTLVREEGAVNFRPRRHDDTPQRFLGVDGVHDLDTLVDALMAADAMAPWIASTLAWELLGIADDEVVTSLATTFVDSGHDLSALVRATLQRGLDGDSAPIVLGPLPWYVIARRVTGANPPLRRVQQLLRSTGQLPMLPPNVAGWPGGRAWFSSSSLVARTNLAAVLAEATPDGEVLEAANGDDFHTLASALGIVDFSDDTADALALATAGVDRLAVALISPEFVIS